MIDEKKLIRLLKSTMFIKKRLTIMDEARNAIMLSIIYVIKEGKLSTPAVPADWLMEWIEENRWLEPDIVEVAELKDAIEQKLKE
jgi:hypothetical protein